MTVKTQSLDAELRRAAIRHAASASFWTDIVVYSLVVAVIGAASHLSRGFDPVFVALTAAGGGGAVISWLWFFAGRRRQFAALYLKEWNSRLRLLRDEELIRLAARLEALGATRGTTQITELRRDFDTFRHVLKRKFNSTELTYQRYDLLMENLFLSVVDNLEQVAEKLETAAAFHPDEDRTFDPRASRPSLEALNDAANELLESNEAVLAALRTASLKMSRVKTRRGRARLQMEAALRELSAMIENVHRYSVENL